MIREKRLGCDCECHERIYVTHQGNCCGWYDKDHNDDWDDEEWGIEHNQP